MTDATARTEAHRAAATIVGVMVAYGVLGCRPSDVLSVPPPAGVTVSAAYQNQIGAEGLFTNGKAAVVQGLVAGRGPAAGLLQWGGLLGDEFTYTFFTYHAAYANVDARVSIGTNGFREGGDQALQTLLKGRLTLLSAIPLLEKYEPASGRSKIGEAFAMNGYAELLAAEDYCAGVPLDALAQVQGVSYGTPLTTDSLLRVAQADFDSAAAHTGGDATIAALAAVGLARAQVDRGQFAAAGAAVAGVPTSFVYQIGLESGFQGSPYVYDLYGSYIVSDPCTYVNTADRKGGNGLDYVTAHDPRLVLSTTVAETCDGYYSAAADSVWYYPTKFGVPSVSVPLATGLEARLVEAEAALQTNDVATWAADLNALRADSADTKVMFQNLLPADSTTTAPAAEQVDVMFRERGFWLYGIGTRLGDMRRLIRQYGRDQSTVFPVGPYPNASNPKLPSPLQNYGTDVSLTLPTPAGGFTDPNPAYKGCLTSTKVA